MKKSIVLIFMCIAFLGNAQPTWVTFTDDHPSKPIVHLKNSTNQSVEYNVVIPGMYCDTINNGESYQRLSLPGGSKWGQPGYPEIPNIASLIAIPECSGFTLNIAVIDSLVLDSINLYPVPLIIQDSNGFVEQFYKNDSVYSLNLFFPGMQSETKEGYLRSQRTLNVFGYAFKYNPQQKVLVVYTQFNVTIDFQNPTTAVNVDNGLFNRITKDALVNYNSQQYPSIPTYPPPIAIPVTWLKLTSCDQADNIDADYLIITHNLFFSPHSMALQQLANHKATLNGFNVTIVSVEDILSLSGWDIGQNPLPNLVAEKKIREFIRRVYAGQHAPHTYDGNLAFVCLVGDSKTDASVVCVPTSYDPDPTIGLSGFIGYNDYYYSCVTKPNGQWDMYGDLFIGRISVDDNTGLFYYVQKLKQSENEANFENRRKNNVLCFGGIYSSTPNAERVFWASSFKNWLNNICPLDYQNEVIDFDDQTAIFHWRERYIMFLNSTDQYVNSGGANLVIHHGHGATYKWNYGNEISPTGFHLSTVYKQEELTNKYKYPTIISHSCQTANFAMETTENDCMGEVMTTYSPDAGYVAYIGSTVDILNYNYNTLPPDHPNTFISHIVNNIYTNQSHVIGEALLGARILCTKSGLGAGGFDYANFVYSFLGDPAYNCMTPGYEITHDVILNPPVSPTPPYMISNKIFVRAGAKLTLGADLVLQLVENGQLIIDEGAILEICNNVKLIGVNVDNKIIINGIVIGPGGTITNPTPIVGLTLESLSQSTWGGIDFNNPNLIVNLSGGSISYCGLTGSLNKLEAVNNTMFLNSNITLINSGLSFASQTVTGTNISISNPQSGSSVVEILNSVFTDSPAANLISLDHVNSYIIQNCSITYDHGIGIDLNYSGWNGSNYLINQNYIQNSGSPPDNTWGIKVYSSKTDITQNHITHNRYGISCLNASQTRIKGNSAAPSLSATQQISDNYQNQVRAYDNSFPWYLHYNELKNSLVPNSFLIYYDNSVLPEGGGNTDNNVIFNVNCNCTDDDTPGPQLYPVGSYQFTYWCANGLCITGVPDGGSFDQAVAAMDSGNYTVADSMFRSVIVTSPGTDVARESAKILIPVTEKLTMNFAALKTYYLETPELHADSMTDHLVYRLMNQCDVIAENFNNAITWYENDILNPASVADSVYSIIDLSDTYLLMQADSGLKSNANNIHGQLIQYIPKDRQDYVARRQKWIEILFTDDPVNTDGKDNIQPYDYELSQNNPNPFFSATELSFVAPKDGDVILTVTDMMGQTIFNETHHIVSGNNKISLDMSGYADGIYLVNLTFDTQITKNIKIIKQQ